MSKTVFEVWGVTKSGNWEYQSCESKREDAERIERIIRDGYAQVVIKEVVS